MAARQAVGIVHRRRLADANGDARELLGASSRTPTRPST